MSKIRDAVMNHNSQKGSSVCSRSQIERVPDSNANESDAASFKSGGSVDKVPKLDSNQKSSASPKRVLRHSEAVPSLKPDLKIDIAAIE